MPVTRPFAVAHVNSNADKTAWSEPNVNSGQQYVKLGEESVKALKWLVDPHDELMSRRRLVTHLQ